MDGVEDGSVMFGCPKWKQLADESSSARLEVQYPTYSGLYTANRCSKSPHPIVRGHSPQSKMHNEPDYRLMYLLLPMFEVPREIRAYLMKHIPLASCICHVYAMYEA